MRALSILAASALALGIAGAANTADAACKRFGFTVNDYGKEGPTNDAKALLDKHVAKWASDNGISDYRIGRKSVKCELFLDFVVFDEHTCTASANVCWGGDMSKIAPSESEDVASDSEKPPAPVSKVTAGLKREKPAESDTETAEADADASATDEPDTETAAAEADAQPDAQAPAAAVASTADNAPPVEDAPQATAAIAAPDAENDDEPGVAVSAGSPIVETGALGDESNASLEAKSNAPAADKMAATGDEEEAAAASSAAAAAAAAAERAAAAAETAAAAAKEAAAAAVAASAANRGVIVPPIDGGR